jgi:hypothetical protein
MVAAACAVGRLNDGTWIGFAPTMEDGYSLVVGEGEWVAAVSDRAEPDDLVALAIAYFADELGEPPETLAATHGDLGALVRAVAEAESDPARRARLAEAVDAVDDGLAADAVVGRLSRCLEGQEEPLARLERRAAELSA